MAEYLFTSERLGFRNWKLEDEAELHEMNTDPEVMNFFPSVYTDGQSLELIIRMQKQFAEFGYCYFAVELLSENKLIGFIGLCYQTFEADFTPCTDIGWRLKKEFWGLGLATEGANRCLSFAFETLNLDEVVCIASEVNIASLNVMKKIGMQKTNRFDHPKMLNDDRLKSCLLYSISKSDSELMSINL